MQISPAFTEYKEHYRTPLFTDDRGERYSFVCFSGERKSGYTKCIGKNYAILSDKMKYLQSKATSYEDTAFFKNRNFPFGPLESFIHVIPGFRIYPVYEGSTGYIENGIRISFRIEKITLSEKLYTLWNDSLKAMKLRF